MLGQILVVLYQPRWLPPMGQWQSGLLPYRALLFSQVLIIWLMASIAWDYSHDAGWFVEQGGTSSGRVVVGLSIVYFTGMVYRYARRMRVYPDQRWLGGTIPIVFHCVLASFLFVAGAVHAW